jgi:hypothetical protein
VLARLTPLVAAPAGVGELPHVHAEHESGLLLRGVLRGPHVFPFCDEYRSVRVLLSGLWCRMRISYRKARALAGVQAAWSKGWAE